MYANLYGFCSKNTHIAILTYREKGAVLQILLDVSSVS